ncbi:hypothetical protein Taro_024389 [Colocasia esculenta]|uniref:Uncharacterized protein n=1 Tax=Colocasia esculenta TaxID=4460 RepID=A0A843V075_COLES|nr:hypothetical protein [Colocasia esculenta]
MCSTRCENSSPGRRYGCINIVDITRIFVCMAIETVREAAIRNWHFDPVGTRLDSKISGPVPKFLSRSVVAGCRCDRIRTPLCSNAIRRRFGVEKSSFHTLKLRFQPTISPFPRSSGSNVSLDHANP